MEKWQGWEFAHRLSEQIARFLQKNVRPERFAQGGSFLVSDLSESLMVAHFLVRDLSNLLTSLIFGERPEQLAHITHQK